MFVWLIKLFPEKKPKPKSKSKPVPKKFGEGIGGSLTDADSFLVNPSRYPRKRFNWKPIGLTRPSPNLSEQVDPEQVFWGEPVFPEQVWQVYFRSEQQHTRLTTWWRRQTRRWSCTTMTCRQRRRRRCCQRRSQRDTEWRRVQNIPFSSKKNLLLLIFFSSQRSARPRWSKKCERGNGAFPECRTLSFFPRGGKNNSPSPFRQNFTRLLPLLFPPLLLNQGWRASHDRVNNNITRSKLRRCHQRCGKLYTA